MEPGLLGGILGFISKPLQSVLDKLLPDKTKQAEFKHLLEMALLKMPFQVRMAFEKRVLAEMQHPQWFRDLVRPIITFCAWFTYMFVKGVVVYVLCRTYVPAILAVDPSMDNLPVIKGMLDQFVTSVFTVADFYIVMLILGFWFGPKAFERVIDKFASTGGIRQLFIGDRGRGTDGQG